jgi:hypothetical protein
MNEGFDEKFEYQAPQNFVEEQKHEEKFDEKSNQAHE